MPHDVQLSLIKRDLVGKDGAERLRVLRAHLTELPSFRSGPYADIRRWLQGEIDAIQTQARTRHQDTFAVPREGHRQIAVLGAPNAGKSALLKALSGIQIKVADYAFATLKPTPCLIKVNDALIQLVEIPGLMPDTSEDHVSIRSLLAVARAADCHLYLASVRDDPSALAYVIAGVRDAGAERPAALCITGADLLSAADDRPARLQSLLPDIPTVCCSPTTGEGIEAVRTLIWQLAGLIRVYPKSGSAGGKPFILDRGATALDLAHAIHHDLAARFMSARVWGASARFPGQTVGPAHVLADEDTVDIQSRK